MGGALGLVITTDVPIEGRHAQPVYVDDSLPIVGPSRACVVITGEIPLAGGPPIPVRLAPAGTPAIGPAIPVYVVSGSLSSGTAPANTVLPAISGTLAIGSVLSTTDGTWTGTAPIVYTYQWKRNGVAIVGETNNTYTLTASDPGTAITVEVTATNASGSASATSAAVNPSSLLTSLISYWTLNEASGNRADSVGGNTLTDINTVTQAVGKIAGAGQFVALNSETLTHASNASLQTGDIDFTVAAWFYLDTLADMSLISKDMSGGGKREFDLEFFSSAGAVNKFRMRLFRAVDSSISVNDTTVISTATWYLVVGWHDAAADTMNIQVNGGAVVSAATGGALQAASDAEWRISSRQFGPGAFANGRIDEAGFWKRVLTAGERTALYNGGNGVTFPF
jgi:hypothetical protein